jgi:opacity protein-like surface antigen
MLGQVIHNNVWRGAALGLVLAGTAQAQDPRVEIGASAGWTFSDGVTFDGVLAGDGNVYNSIEPKDSFSYSLNLGFFVTPNVEVGGLFSQQKSKLEVGGTTVREIGDQSVDNYHGYFAYNFGESDAMARFYVLGGLGATRYGGVPYSVGGVSGSTNSTTKFSTTWGAGVKIYPGPKFGLKLGVRWTPTYIKSDAEGWWCDPYWGCYVVGDAQYSNQFELTGGIVIRF